MAKQTQSWTADDGKVFATRREAEHREASIAINEWCDDHGIGRGGEWSGEMVASVIREDAARLHEILSLYLGREWR